MSDTPKTEWTLELRITWILALALGVLAILGAILWRASVRRAELRSAAPPLLSTSAETVLFPPPRDEPGSDVPMDGSTAEPLSPIELMQQRNRARSDTIATQTREYLERVGTGEISQAELDAIKHSDPYIR